MIPWWHDGTLLWETLILGGEVMPGIAAVECDVERKLDIQSIKGGDGATISDEGYVPAPVQIALKLWLREQWVEWLRILPSIHPRQTGGLRRPLDIYHPATESVGIGTIYVRKLAAPRGEGGGARVIAIEAVQWFDAPKTAKKSTTPKAAAKPGLDVNAFDIPSPGQSGSAALNI